MLLGPLMQTPPSPSAFPCLELGREMPDHQLRERKFASCGKGLKIFFSLCMPIHLAISEKFNTDENQ